MSDNVTIRRLRLDLGAIEPHVAREVAARLTEAIRADEALARALATRGDRPLRLAVPRGLGPATIVALLVRQLDDGG